jgi:enoyl-CoA hydratase
MTTRTDEGLEPYAPFDQMTFDRPSDGVLLITLNRPEKLNAADGRMHGDFARIWPVVAADERTRVCVVTGAGRAFSSGGDLESLHEQIDNFPTMARVMKEASDIVYNMINCEKPIVSAINGSAVGAGLAVALLADISIISRTARLSDGHIRIGLGAGDHAPVIWPLLCGMAKAKYYLMTSRFVTGEEAERIGLVSACTEPEDVLPTALEIARDLAGGPQHAIRWTKHAMNNWLRTAGPIFDAALALEMLNLFDEDVVEGVSAIQEKRPPRFPSSGAERS